MERRVTRAITVFTDAPATVSHAIYDPVTSLVAQSRRPGPEGMFTDGGNSGIGTFPWEPSKAVRTKEGRMRPIRPPGMDVLEKVSE